MDSKEKDLMNFLLEQSQRDISYEKHLERQKILLLAQKEVEHWKRLVYETERFREQCLWEDRHELKQVFKLRNRVYKLNKPRLKIVIDQGLEQWIKDDDGAENDYQSEINKLRSRIDHMNLQATRYWEVFENVRESKSHQIVQESARKVREEEVKIEESQKTIDDLWKKSHEQANKEWSEMKLMIVEFSQLCTESNMMDLEKEADLQNNQIKKVKIIQLHEEIKQVKIEQEEEAKRREIELSERILIPIKITPMTIENTMFKNPNDFPALIDKIDSTRKSYEQIFKRQLRKTNKKGRSKCTVHFNMLFGGPKRKGKTRKTQLHPSVTAETATKPVTTDDVATHPKKYQRTEVSVAKELPSNPPDTKLDKPSVQVERHTTKCASQSDKDLSKSQPLPSTNENIPTKDPPVANKRKASDESTEDQHRPICNVQGQRIKQRPAQSVSQPELPTVTRDNAKSEPPRKRPSLETPISASTPSHVQDHREFKKPQLMQEYSPEKQSRKSKPKKVAFKPQPEAFEIECDSFSLSPEKSVRKMQPRSKQQPVEQAQHRSPSPPPQQMKQQPPADPMDFKSQEQQQTVEDDNFSFGSASPSLDSHQSKDDGGSFFDTGSISSLNMVDRENSSDLGFDLSPVGPSTNNRRDEHGEGSGSDGNTSDFNFLASPPTSAAPPGSQSGGRKDQDCFAFTDKDSGTGFDFF
ncbi:uncharacterized protein LOC135701801 [Ochlerotatus camptorhynchus]|uniref:uncharacterized protein LOC135701801 n=1 Tax=Ochlerotatus camptorhynchus TaxID=644619 RepID=UPI0031E0751E